MSQRDETHQPERRAERTTNRAYELIRNLERELSILRDLLQENQSLQDQLKQVKEELRDAQERFAKSDEARIRAENLGRDWERRAKSIEDKLNTSRNDVVRDALKELGKARVLSYLDALAARASQGMETPAQKENIDGPSPHTLMKAIEKWVNEITGLKLSRIFEQREVEVSRDDTVGLVEFEPSNPFSGEVSKALCRVLSSGWCVGNIIIERASLEPIEAISTSAAPSTVDAEASNVTPPNGSSDLVEAVSETSTDQLSPVISNDADELNDDVVHYSDTDDHGQGYPEQSESQPDSPEFELLKRATDMLEERKTLNDRERKLWDSFIQAAKSGQALSSEEIDELRHWSGGKAKVFSKIQRVLNEETSVREVFEEYWRKLINEYKPIETRNSDDAGQQPI